MKKIILAAIATLFIVSNILFSQTTFINEIDYLGSDQGAEIAGSAGQNLTGWSLVYYTVQGNVDKAVYLTGLIIPNQQNGFGSVWMEVSQSGPGGALALVNTAGNVVQFLSYGAYTTGITNGGAASGMSPDYAGAQLLPDQSLQLTGVGLSYLDFIWGLPGGSTPGTVNTNQSFAGGQFSDHENSSLATIQDQRTAAIRLFPNPAVDQIQVRLNTPPNGPGALIIYNLQGQPLRRQAWAAGTPSERIDVSQLPAGQYVIQIDLGHHLLIQRFTKN